MFYVFRLFATAVVATTTMAAAVVLVTHTPAASQSANSVPGKPAAPMLLSDRDMIGVVWAPPMDNGGSLITRYAVVYNASSASPPAKQRLYPDVPINFDNSRMYNGLYYVGLPGLSNGVEYKVAVIARNANGWGLPSDWSKITPGGLAAPVLLPGDRNIYATWTPLLTSYVASIWEPEINYEVETCRSTGSECADISLDTTSAWLGDVHNASRADMSNDVTYKVRVRAALGLKYRNQQESYERAMYSSYSAWASATPAAGLVPQPVSKRGTPGKPTTISLTPGRNSLAVSWQAPTDNGSPITEYRVGAKGSAPTRGGWRRMVAVTKDSRGGLRPYASLVQGHGMNSYTNKVRVIARNANGWGLWSDVAVNAPIPYPGKPGTPVLTADNGSINVSWSPPTDSSGSTITRYKVIWQAVNSTSSWNYKFISAASTSTTTSTSTTLTDLVNGTTYKVKVIAENVNGLGPVSDQATATPQENRSTDVSDSDRVPGVMVAPAVTAGAGELVVSWEPPHSPYPSAAPTTPPTHPPPQSPQEPPSHPAHPKQE